jgi:D-beta-D-heptose 7-phosphate kinase/D-beta-D-heptose 1-phosphate adenosyltransferase
MGLDKIIAIEDIRDIVSEFRRKNPNKKVVTTNGAFDILHSGHAKSFELAKSYGHLLVVGLNSDYSIKQYKNPDRPIIPQSERAAMISFLEMVDYIVIFDETDPINFLERVRPDFHVKSESGYKGIEGPIVEKYGGKVITYPDIPGISTTEIINRILELEKKKP